MLRTPSSHIPSPPLPSRQELALIAVTMVWGGTFLVVHLAMQYSGPLFFVGLRFVTAGIIGLVVFRKVMAGLTRTEVVAGMAIGASIFLGYGLQTFGLQTISSSKSAFLTALYVPIVPLLQWLVMGKPPRLMSWIGIGLAFTGLLLVAGPESGGLGLSVGEIATMLSTLAIAAEVLLIGHFAGKVDARRVTTVQLLAAGVLALLAMPVAGESVPDFSWVWLVAAVGMACASVIIQLTMNWAQKSLSPTRATVIYASEPVWAGIVGRVAGDRLPGLAILGAALIVGGVLVSELKWTRRKAGTAPA
ncbi:putative DMT superfamily transporter inner membrane protein [Delftia tsuruhatensis]|uniref:DMT family transporter n=1 Tax=Delftia tsuruhatensis TaxID=180282 RepID=UPI001E809502|nr:DMT family transporter [Delftia tsuruhatensis]CAB5717760.1 putative DMT superfamily transporter inner membrane protein [Delftia tsuruhatensis]CAC9686204.1 putative DMT superfamily transporter inner membrane protein [Delftia tsuruhatensis]